MKIFLWKDPFKKELWVIIPRSTPHERQRERRFLCLPGRSLRRIQELVSLCSPCYEGQPVRVSF